MNKNTEFDLKWPHGHVTRDGDKAEYLREIYSGGNNGNKHLFLVTFKTTGIQIPYSFWDNGRLYAGKADSTLDIFNAPAPLELKVGDFVVTEDGVKGVVLGYSDKYKNIFRVALAGSGYPAFRYTKDGKPEDARTPIFKDIVKIIDFEV